MASETMQATLETKGVKYTYFELADDPLRDYRRGNINFSLATMYKYTKKEPERAQRLYDIAARYYLHGGILGEAAIALKNAGRKSDSRTIRELIDDWMAAPEVSEFIKWAERNVSGMELQKGMHILASVGRFSDFRMLKRPKMAASAAEGNE